MARWYWWIGGRIPIKYNTFKHRWNPLNTSEQVLLTKNRNSSINNWKRKWQWMFWRWGNKTSSPAEKFGRRITIIWKYPKCKQRNSWQNSGFPSLWKRKRWLLTGQLKGNNKIGYGSKNKRVIIQVIDFDFLFYN